MESQFPPEILARIEQCGVVAVLVVADANDAVPLANALLAGGVDVMELTLRTEAALAALRAIRAEVPAMVAGVGTVLTPDQVTAVTTAGAQFGVAPGTNPRVIKAAQSAGLPFAPGVVSPSDLETAVELGCRELKFFPAEPSGGMKYLRSMKAPYAHLGVRFIPLGGINADNMAEYLRDAAVPAVGGSWLAPPASIKAHDWNAITQRAAAAQQQVQTIRTP